LSAAKPLAFSRVLDCQKAEDNMLFSDYITIKEAAELWGVTTRAITYHVVAGRIPRAIKKGGIWLVPMSASKPEDLRKYNRRRPKKESNTDKIL
jgi:hypothetical protein